ncbi:MAG: phosphatidylserine decarboxylase [Hyphomicrobiales bacterium]
MGFEIKYIDRASKKLITEKVPGFSALRFLYYNPFGKLALNGVVKRKFLSYIFGQFMNSKLSRPWIRSFIDNYNIELSDYKKELYKFRSFNDFFYRELKPNKRSIANDIVSPADGKIVAFDCVEKNTLFYVKGSEFSLSDFLKEEDLSEKYRNGSLAIIRLAPSDYHRFHFPASGNINQSKRIKGKYYSVSPIAMKKSLEIFCQNKREYSTLKTEKLGDILISEIGATFVGSIQQTYKPNTFVKKGNEKGYFAFGGSSILLLFEKGKIKIDDDIIENTKNGLETNIMVGERIATPL